MKFVFYTNSVSPHQLPLARELVRRLGREDYRYIYTTPMSDERKNLGWNESAEDWIVYEGNAKQRCRELLMHCDILLTGLRDFDLIEQRCKTGKITLYACERWFKPILLNLPIPQCLILRFPWLAALAVSGRLRMIIPSYRRMAKRLVSLASKHDCFKLMPYGVWAERDFLSLGIRKEKMSVWGYCVAPSLHHDHHDVSPRNDSPLGVLWIGRMISWKRVDTLICAVALAASKGVDIRCTLIGSGPMCNVLKKLSARRVRQYKLSTNPFTFKDALPIAEIRNQMRHHDVYALTSDACEGWGAALSEALEENMYTVGTFEAGSSATLLPNECLFHSGDTQGLCNLLSNMPIVKPLNKLSVANSLQLLQEVCEDRLNERFFAR